MTDAFVELFDKPCGIVRVGANAPYPAPYRYSVTFVIHETHVEPVGFDHKNVPPSEFRDVIRKINEATGKLVEYDRAGPPPTRVVQIDPALIKGRILMTIDRSHLSRTHVASPARAQKRDGSINGATLKKDGDKAFKLFASGKEIMLNVERVVLADGSVIDMFHHIKA